MQSLDSLADRFRKSLDYDLSNAEDSIEAGLFDMRDWLENMPAFPEVIAGYIPQVGRFATYKESIEELTLLTSHWAEENIYQLDDEGDPRGFKTILTDEEPLEIDHPAWEQLPEVQRKVMNFLSWLYHYPCNMFDFSDTDPVRLAQNVLGGEGKL